MCASLSVLDIWKYANQRLEYLLCLVVFMLLYAFLQDVACCPKHAQSRIFAFVHGVHRSDYLVCLLNPSLLPEIEYFLDSHIPNPYS